jgi:hypothetical protein
MDSIRTICKNHPVRLFYFRFSVETENLARWIAREFQLPLFKRPSEQEKVVDPVGEKSHIRRTA